MFAMILLAASMTGQIETRYDKFRDYTTYNMDLGDLVAEDDCIEIAISRIHKGEDRIPARDTDHVHLGIYRFGKRWRYIQHHDAIMMQGRSRFAPLRVAYSPKSDLEDGEVMESFHFHFTFEEVKSHLRDRKTPWEIKLGYEDPLSIGRETLAKIDAFIKEMQGEGGK
jgi:hypothetical protein